MCRQQVKIYVRCSRRNNAFLHCKGGAEAASEVTYSTVYHGALTQTKDCYR